ncbi:MAG: hypothetical protein K9N06_10925 [Candidatus Cloacimonetes bacterium]|nr:hypothetical protein [Candidatus Cloacimonadota bacterium]
MNRKDKLIQSEFHLYSKIFHCRGLFDRIPDMKMDKMENAHSWFEWMLDKMLQEIRN